MLMEKLLTGGIFLASLPDNIHQSELPWFFWQPYKFIWLKHFKYFKILHFRKNLITCPCFSFI